MCRAIVKNQPTGTMSLRLNALLQDEPLALYIDPAGALALRLSNGAMVALGHDGDSEALAEQDEVTIESFVGGILAAGYRVGIRSAA